MRCLRHRVGQGGLLAVCFAALLLLAVMDSEASAGSISSSPLGTSPVQGQFPYGGHHEAVYHVDLEAGQVLSVRTTYGSLCAFAPDSTTLGIPADYEPHGIPSRDDVPHGLTVHAERSGRYYLVVAGHSSSYTLTWTLRDGEADDFLPGVELPASPVIGSLDALTDTRDIYRIDLEPGDLVTFGATSDRHHWQVVELFGPSATETIGVIRREVSHLEDANWLVPPRSGGTYSMVVRTLGGGHDYSLDWRVSRPSVVRLAGDDRYQTSSRIAGATYAHARVAVIATGQGYADALSASALAGELDAPLLLIRPGITGGLYWDTIERLSYLGVEKVYLVGGTAAVSSDVERAIETAAGTWTGARVKRLAGENRYATSRVIAEEVARLAALDGRSINTAFLVRGDEYADALAAAPHAFSRRIPVLLTATDSLDAGAAAFIERRNVRDVVVVGGDSAVSRDAAIQATRLNGATTKVERISGVNRYETATNLARYAVAPRAWASWEHVGLATGHSFADALSGSSAVGRRGGVLLLTGPTTLDRFADEALRGCGSEALQVLVFGGAGAVSDAVEMKVRSLLE
ncbi:MAG: cell wall-binding repeat-containing protein [Coriobacteriia bacterium]|nr:cell wall-binding repeat-containing protein [Coriobacteriia bacterium]